MTLKLLGTKTLALCIIRIGPFGSETSEPVLSKETRPQAARRLARKYGLCLTDKDTGELMRLTFVDQHTIEYDGTKYTSDMVNQEVFNLESLRSFI